MPSRILYSPNIVKGERKGEREPQFSDLTMPSRILYSPNIAKGERRGEREPQFSDLTMPSRILYSPNIVKGERKGKWKTTVFRFDHAGPHPIFSKYSERRAQRRTRTEVSESESVEPHPLSCKYTQIRRKKPQRLAYFEVASSFFRSCFDFPDLVSVGSGSLFVFETTLQEVG